MEKAKLVCLKCGTEYSGKVKCSLLGFTKFQCVKCQNVNIYQLTSKLQKIYLIFCVGVVIFRGIPGILVLYPLIKSHLIWLNLTKKQREIFKIWEKNKSYSFWW